MIPFQLSVSGRGPANYVVRAFAAGRGAEAPLALPDPQADPDALSLAVGRSLFPNPVRQLLIDVARGADEAGARIQIQLYAAPDLADLPWELATLGQSRLWRPAVREDYTLVRSGELRPPPRPLPLSGPVRLLIACAPDAETAIAPLGHALAEAARSGRMVIDLLRDADPLALREALAEEPCHMLHIIAADAWGQGDAARLRLGRGLDGAGLASMLSDHADLRLVTLAASADADAAALSAVANRLHDDLGISAIALGGLDTAQVAAFCGPCYTAIAAGDPVDLAVTDGRAALEGQAGAWGAPRLWLVPGTEALFTFVPRPARAEPPPEVAATPPRMPVGAPLRPRRAAMAMSRALQAARAFVVDTTTVGKPMKHPPRAAHSHNPLLQPQLIALAAAILVLITLVSRVLPSNAAGDEKPGLTPVPTLGPSARPGPPPGPASVPEPRTFFSTVVASGDTLESVARRAGSDPAALAALNRLAPGEALRPGRPLVVPVYHDGESLPPAPIIKQGNPDQPLVAMTFDIEIDDASLYAILDALDARQIKGTFFVTGRWVKSFPEAAKAIVRRGHELGNHSLTHPAFSAIGADGAVNELAETERIVREITGASTRPYFRFPYGDSTPQMVETIGRAGYIAYHWSADDAGLPAWLERVAADPAQARGAILLLHGRHSSAAALPGYLDRMKALGLQPTTLSAVLR
ncbi:MAG: polysaccharide deacetylase family protein [Oscillochloridaceae bacterium]|nr:polysaccharide deacetylase family protein [Chloroflexaceae bacterium]MDW8391123.1 polysaccharide deacetylase family protein [Oscillochloridaceae bacterium]